MSVHRSKFYGRLLCGAAAVSLLTAAGAHAAEDQTQFDIAPQPLSSALNEFATQSRMAVLFTPDLTGARLSPGLSKTAEPETALAMMLQGTGLSWKRNGDTFVIVSASDPQSGSAAGDGADQGTVQALIVTAQKREENIQDVPIAMSAFTQEDLTRSQVAGGPDLMTQVPNMTFTKTNFSSYSIQIRGIGTQAISATTDPAVAVAFNNTPFVRNRFFEQEFYDLERVEVLRGPQGTLYGRNATAGVVNIISAKPKFRYEAKLSADVGNYGSSRLEGMVNIPLVEDKVALRIAGAWTKRDGYDTNQITGKQIDGRDLWSTRTSLRFAPNDRLDVNLIWDHFQEDDDRLRSGKQLCNKDVVTHVGSVDVSANPYQSVPDEGQQGGVSTVQSVFSQGCKPASLYSPDSFQTPNGQSIPYYFQLQAIGLPARLTDPYVSATQSKDLRVIESTVDPHYRAKTDIVELQAKFDLTDTLGLTSETAWGSDFVFSTQDFNRFNTAPGAWSANGQVGQLMLDRGVLSPGPNGPIFCDPQVGCSDRLVAVDLSTDKSTQFSQELRLASNFDGPFNFSLGANFLRHDADAKYYVFINSLGLIAAKGGIGLGNSFPYIVGQTTNSECFRNGPVAPDLNQVYSLGCVYMDPNPIDNLNDRGHNYFLSNNPYKLISYAVFGEAYYNITSNLKVTAGLRWTVDKKEAPRIPSWLLASDTVGYPVQDVTRQEWREPTGRLTVDWKPDLAFTDETLLYASAARGYKAGGANPPPFGIVMFGAGAQDSPLAAAFLEQSATHPKTFDPEFVNAFEVGSKNTLADGRVTLNLAAFYYDYTGYQISQIVDRSALNLNFDAKVWGLEIEVDWRPIENLRLGFKGGYENTRVNDGERAIDLMDRTAGHPGWSVVRPFPTFPSSCILPTALYTPPGGTILSTQLWGLGGPNGGNPGGCELAYVLGLDPGTERPFGEWDGTAADATGASFFWSDPTLYPGFDPSTAPNNGEGFYKDLSGKELPNAPHFTATITADYTLPLPNDWLMTLHTDLYYQSEAWTRIFNTPGYDKLKAYNNVNLAAIFTNEDAGWKVMAYVKNVFDRDSITGAFLNSDDTGLTTNVFLTEPRLYGIRVTKDWTGGSPFGSFGARGSGPYPLTVEIGGQVQRQDAPYATLHPDVADAFAAAINPLSSQNRNLDWGDGREIKLTWQPQGPWSVSAAARFGKTNSGRTRDYRSQEGDKACAYVPTDTNYVDKYSLFCKPTGAKYGPQNFATEINWSYAEAWNREEHTLVDFEVGRDVGMGLGLQRSRASAGLRYAGFESDTTFMMYGVPDMNIPQGWRDSFLNSRSAYPASFHRYESSIQAHREFKGAGPTISWDAARAVLGNEETGHLDVDWSVKGGLLFGKQTTSVTGDERSGYWTGPYYHSGGGSADLRYPTFEPSIPIASHRAKSVTVPLVDLSLGLSYSVDGFRLGAGYRWERYFNVLDAGYTERKSYDRTFDGPYFKIAVGFGG
jgi:outer membrane receptor protein involved in Fe transport